MAFKLRHAVLGLTVLIIAFFGVDFCLETSATNNLSLQSISEKKSTVTLKDNVAALRDHIVNRTTTSSIDVAALLRDHIVNRTTRTSSIDVASLRAQLLNLTARAFEDGGDNVATLRDSLFNMTAENVATLRDSLFNLTKARAFEDGDWGAAAAQEFEEAMKLIEEAANATRVPMRPIPVQIGAGQKITLRGNNNNEATAANQTVTTTAAQQSSSEETRDTRVVGTASTDEPKTKVVPPLLETHHMNANQTDLQARNYFELARIGHFPQANSLPPLQILTTYIQQNSQQRLEQMWKDCGNMRCEAFDSLKFVVGRYSCPLEAGNRLMKMMNGLVWAIVTQRVFLWGYWDYPSCVEEERAGGELPEGRCDENGTLNTPQDCAEILEVAKWVPSWDEWSVKLNLSQPIRACVVGARSYDSFAVPMDGPNVPRVIRVGQQINMETAMMMTRRGQKSRQALSGGPARNRAKSMFANGHYFAYGMLFDSLFNLHPSLLPDPNLLYDNDAVDTYVLHSRHQHERENGEDIRLDVSCMQKVIFNRTDPSRPCVVYSMTDRAPTKAKLPAALAAFNCTAIFSSNTTQGKSFSNEHGPFAGRGYYQDLALVRNARLGIIAPNKRARARVGIRTSTALARSLIEFRRILDSPPGAAPVFFKECYTY